VLNYKAYLRQDKLAPGMCADLDIIKFKKGIAYCTKITILLYPKKVFFSLKQMFFKFEKKSPYNWLNALLKLLP